MTSDDWTEELDFIRRWRGDDPWGRAARRSRSLGADVEPKAEPSTRPSRRRPAPLPLMVDSDRIDAGGIAADGIEARPAALPVQTGGARIDFEDPGCGTRLILSDPDADRSIRTAFAGAAIDFPGGEYCRIVHPLGPGTHDDPELSRLPSSGLLFDLETLGFHGRPLFLIGLLFPKVESIPMAEWCVVQLLARDYAEEEAILRAFAVIAGAQNPWVSFNGKSFDLPFLRARARFHRVPLPDPRDHRDLLHVARRVYRGVLPNCRLQTLESALFARYRWRDLPGDEIPMAYHDYVRTGGEADMVRILRHNRDDLVTLARLHVHLSG